MVAPPLPIPWVLEEMLGRGAQASTWRARHRDTGALAAVKIFRLADAADWKAHELFLRECEVLRALDHPGVPRFIEAHIDEEAGDLYLVMQLLDGRPLSERLRSGRTSSTGELLDILRQALDLLDYLHGRRPPVIHRDIKPGNLLLSAQGRLSLVDFGGVRVALSPEGGSTIIGTFGYMAPEQLHGASGPASDLYALGMTLASLAAGIPAPELPRDGLEIDLGAVMPPSPLRALLSKLTRADPAQRLGSVSAARQALEEGSAPPPVTDPADRAADPPSGALGWVWRVLLFILWVTATVTDAGLGLVERVAMPASYERKRKRIGRRHRRHPRRRERQLARLEARHARNTRALHGARDNLRALVDKSEPYKK